MLAWLSWLTFTPLALFIVKQVVLVQRVITDIPRRKDAAKTSSELRALVHRPAHQATHTSTSSRSLSPSLCQLTTMMAYAPQQVTRINTRFGRVIDYEEAPTYSPDYRVGLYYVGDVMLQTPVREVCPQ